MSHRYGLNVNTLKGALLPVLLLAAWQYQSQQGAVAAYAYPPLRDIAHALLEVIRDGELWVNLLGSLRRASTGLLIGASLGLGVGLLMAFSRIANTLISPIFHTLRQVPILGLTPLIGLWVGNGESAKVLIIALAAFYPMVLNSYEGLRSVDQRYYEVARIHGLSRWQSFRLVQLPAALPGIFSGLGQAIPFAWITTVGSELLFNAGAGLGNLMMTAELGSRMDIIVVCAVSVTLLGVVMNYLAKALANHALRWRRAH